MQKSITFLNYIRVLVLFVILFSLGCKNTDTKTKNSKVKTQEISSNSKITKDEPKGKVSKMLLDLESEYSEMLIPIASLKSDKPKIYWFIVSWLKTNYKTPNWTGYYSEEWKRSAKLNGIDCSGFSRVMLDQVFDKKVSGGSTRLLTHHCDRVGLNDLQMGDLVFFRAPYSTSDKIVHVGVYLQNDYFVHATSTKSAAKGLGLAVNSLVEENWSKEFVTGGKVKI